MGKKIAELDGDYSDIVGMPDDWDRQNIKALIDLFKSTVFPLEIAGGKKINVRGDVLIKQCVADSRRYHQNSIDLSRKGHNLKSVDSELRAVMTMPTILDHKLRQGYPTLFKGKHLTWFLRNFPEFKISKEQF
jgi:hypothetical protein